MCSIPAGKAPEYIIKSHPRGICLIINNQNFDRDTSDPNSKPLQSRKGSEVDTGKIVETMRRRERLHNDYGYGIWVTVGVY